MAVLTPSSESTARLSSVASKESTRHTMNVFVRWNQGKTLCLQVDPDASAVELAVAVWEHALRGDDARGDDAPSLARDFCMVCAGKVLDEEDDRPVRLLVGGASREALPNVQIWRRQRGGCFMVSASILCIITAAIIGSPCTCGLSLFVVPVLLPFLFILPLFCL